MSDESQNLGSNPAPEGEGSEEQKKPVDGEATEGSESEAGAV